MVRLNMRRAICTAISIGSLSSSCASPDDPALASRRSQVPNVPVPPADGPKLGAIAERTPVFERPAKDAKWLGYLHAGAQVARATEPYSTEECDGGWYPVRPRGFVCASAGATTDMKHPTLVAMALPPKLDQPLPYAYARCRKETSIFERDPGKDNAVREVGKFRSKSVMAVVGSWSALDPSGNSQRLGLMTDGHFVTAGDLAAAEPSSFQGVELDDKTTLPVAFVVKRGIRAYRVEKGESEKLAKLDYHATLPLSGRYREIDGLRYWALQDDRFVRHRDVTVLRERNVYPDFVKEDQKWIDVSVVTGSLVLYEGKRAVYATLVSVGRDRLGDPQHTASTPLGTFKVHAKHVTLSQADSKKVADFIDVRDLPWAIELESGPILHAAPWHDRFGIEHGLGSIQLSPADALRVWRFVTPELPENWHGVQAESEKESTLVLVRK
ncbi:MAG TPA: L,D-transpeptidase [Polyangiaceae bacterium]|nr:L,D-transpeptidase [Polyangiaceae bacterium]